MSDHMQSTFFYPWKIPEEISRLSLFFNNQSQSLSYQTYVHTTFYHGSGLTRNWMFNGSIYYVYYLHILRCYFLCQTDADMQCNIWNTQFPYWNVLVLTMWNSKNRSFSKSDIYSIFLLRPHHKKKKISLKAFTSCINTFISKKIIIIIIHFFQSAKTWWPEILCTSICLLSIISKEKHTIIRIIFPCLIKSMAPKP